MKNEIPPIINPMRQESVVLSPELLDAIQDTARMMDSCSEMEFVVPGTSVRYILVRHDTESAGQRQKDSGSIIKQEIEVSGITTKFILARR